MTPDQAGRLSDYLPRGADLRSPAAGTTWFCIRTPRRWFAWAFPLIGRNRWWSITA